MTLQNTGGSATPYANPLNMQSDFANKDKNAQL